MARYEFRCRTCDERFEVQRPMSEASDPAPCPQGHDDTVRLLSAFSTVAMSPAPQATGGGCCGGACGCSR